VSVFVAKLTWGRRAEAALALLEETAGPLVVIEALPLAKVLAELGKRPVLCSQRAATLKRWPGEAALIEGTTLPFAAGTVGALIVTEAWESTWLEVLADRGKLVSLVAEPRTEATRRVICAGLVDLVQRPAGRIHATAGTWHRL
jgi:hypothetical protein